MITHSLILCTHICTMAHKWKSEDNLQKSLLSFHFVGPKNQTWAVSLADKSFYPVSHLTSPVHPLIWHTEMEDPAENLACGACSNLSISSSVCFETGSQVTKARLELLTFLPQPPKQLISQACTTMPILSRAKGFTLKLWWQVLTALIRKTCYPPSLSPRQLSVEHTRHLSPHHLCRTRGKPANTGHRSVSYMGHSSKPRGRY